MIYQKQLSKAGTCNHTTQILWGAITCTCLWYLLLANYSNMPRYILQFVVCCCITMMSYWARWRLKSPASRLFTQPSIQTEIKANIKMASNAENVSIWWRHHGIASYMELCGSIYIWNIDMACHITYISFMHTCMQYIYVYEYINSNYDIFKRKGAWIMLYIWIFFGGWGGGGGGVNLMISSVVTIARPYVFICLCLLYFTSYIRAKNFDK